MKKVLFISYFFPPIGGGGVIRVTKFVKYLPVFGWRPLVLTVKEGFYPVKDASLLDDIPPEAIVKRIKYFEPGHWFKRRLWQSFLANFFYPIFFIPDAQMLWIIPAVIAGWRLIKAHKIEIIFSSSRSYSDHLAALILKRITGVRWVADFRDEWTTSPHFKFVTPIHRNISKVFERQILKNADMVTTVSPGLTNIYQNILGSDKEKFATITNGYDEEDFKGFTESYDKSKDLKFRIIYAGALYGTRRSNLFLQAVKELKLKDIEIEFIGRQKRLSHYDTIKRLSKADVLLLILSPQDGPAVLTGKIFEYLRLRKPIFALAPRNSGAAALTLQLGIGEVADPRSIIDIKQKLTKIYQKWLVSRRSGQSGQKNQLQVPSVNIEIFERKNLTENLAKLFDKLTQKTSKIKLCFIGNLRAPQNQSLVNFFKKYSYEIHFITTQKADIPGIKSYFVGQDSLLDRWTILYFLKTKNKIKKIIHKLKPDILHGQDLVFAGIWAKLTNFHPLVVTCWGSDVFHFDKFIWPEKYLVRQTLALADLVTGSSLAIKNQAVKIGLNPKKFRLVHFGVDLKIFRPRKSRRLSRLFKNQKIIFCPRSIAPIYNTDILIEAFGKIACSSGSDLILSRQNANLKYLALMMKKVEALGLKNRVHFLPQVANAKMADWYNLAEVVISIPDSDSSSVSFLEAMACQKKIVVTNLKFTKEWQKGGYFWQVPTRDIEATSQAMQKALDYPKKKWQPLGRANRQLVVKKAEIKSNFCKLEKLYRDLLISERK